MQNKRILVTGAGGFIGPHLARELYKQGNFVRIVDIKWDDYVEEPYFSEKITLDLREYQNCLKATADMDYVLILQQIWEGLVLLLQLVQM